MIKEHSGILREYLPTFSLSSPIPNLDNLKENRLFVEHVTMNHKGLNWKIFRHCLDEDNYKSFIYAFAIVLKDINPHSATIWQFESNARRLKNALAKKSISYSVNEAILLERCINFSDLRKYCYYVQMKDLNKVLDSLSFD